MIFIGIFTDRKKKNNRKREEGIKIRELKKGVVVESTSPDRELINNR